MNYVRVPNVQLAQIGKLLRTTGHWKGYRTRRAWWRRHNLGKDTNMHILYQNIFIFEVYILPYYSYTYWRGAVSVRKVSILWIGFRGRNFNVFCEAKSKNCRTSKIFIGRKKKGLQVSLFWYFDRNPLLGNRIVIQLLFDQILFIICWSGSGRISHLIPRDYGFGMPQGPFWVPEGRRPIGRGPRAPKKARGASQIHNHKGWGGIIT